MARTLRDTLAAMNAPADDRRRGLVIAAALVATALAVLAYVVTPGDAFIAFDAAIKFVQAEALWSTGFRSMAIPYPGRPFDPAGIFFPFSPPFVFLSGGQYQSIFPSPYAVLSALLLPFGLPAQRAFGVLSGALAAAACGWLSDHRPQRMPVWLLALATPVWFYAIANGEPALSLAASTAAFAVALSGSGPRTDLAAGALLGVAATVRDEAMLLVPGLIVARALKVGGRPRLWALLGAFAGPVLVMALVDWAWLARPPLAHLRHAVPMLDAVLPRARAVLPHLSTLAWFERYQTIVGYWLVGGGPIVECSLAAGVSAAFLTRRRAVGPVILATFLAALAAYNLRILIGLLPAPRSEEGLLRLAPFLILAALPAAPGTPFSRVRTTALVTAVAFLIGAALSLTTTGGKGFGPRLTVGLWPLLVAAAWDGLASWRSWQGSPVVRGVIMGSGGVLIACAVMMQLAIALPPWANRQREDVAALEFVRALPDQVIVIDDMLELQVIAPEYLNRTVLMVARPGDWPTLGQRLAEAGVTRFTVLGTRAHDRDVVAPFRYAESWQKSRHWIGRYVR
jgi:hypothetical protein